MIARLDKWCVTSVILGLAALAFPPLAGSGWGAVPGFLGAVVVVIALTGFFAWSGVSALWHSAALVLLVVLGAAVSLEFVHATGADTRVGSGFWLFNLALWAVAWRGIDGIAAYRGFDPKWQRLANFFVPAAFGLWMIYLWEIAAVGFGVPQVLLPPPGMIGARFLASLDILWADFQQTFLKAVLAGYILGCGSGFLVSILVDRVPFLRRGLLPLGNLVSALPIVGIAPIMVMWFGFDWQSKAAVVVIMTFFPMLVNTVTGLAAAGDLERELLRSYAAGYWQTLIKLRLPAALPFIFNALKINSTLALIGAIVAEFFGTPIVGMGFRISTEVGRMNVDMVWAEILVAALAGSAFYGVVALGERNLTFWHPSFRERQ
jgi:NitT/TauT family transport system permease protein